MAELGVRGIYAETSTSRPSGAGRYGFEDLRDYMMGQMLWNPNMSEQEYAALTKEFIGLFYCGDVNSEAVEYIYQYLLKWDESAVEGNPGCWLNNYSSIKQTFNLEYYGQNGREMQALLENALAIVQANLGSEAKEVKEISYLCIMNQFLTLSGEYYDRYVNGNDEEKAAYKTDYATFYERASTTLPNVWLDNYMCWIEGKTDLSGTDSNYTTDDGVLIEYCPLGWYNRRDGFFDLDPYYYQANFMMNDGTDTVFETQRISNFYAIPLEGAPTRPGYIFDGWYLDAEGTAAMKFYFGGTKITGANTQNGQFTVYAKWSECIEHSWDAGTVTKEPTYTEAGEKTYTCGICSTTRKESVDKLVCTEHSWDAGTVTKEPTYTEAGEKTYTCGICSTTKIESVDKLVCTEHSWDAGTVTKEPTQTEAGEKVYTCSNCGETRTEPIAALSCTHNWNAGVVTKQPTVWEDGERVYTCSVCSETKSENIPALPCPHDWHEETVNDKGECTYLCNMCGERRVEEIADRTPQSPQTGDDSMLWLYMTVLLLGISMLMISKKEMHK